MKRELFHVGDEEFMTLLSRTNHAFSEASIPYMFVGGVAAQIHLADYLTSIFDSSLLELINSDKIRSQDCLRATDDVDIAVKFIEDDKKSRDLNEIENRKCIYSVLDNIVDNGEFISPTEEHIVSIKLERRGHKRPQFELGVDGVSYPDKLVSFNIYRSPEDVHDKDLREFEDSFYDLFLERAHSINLRYAPNVDIKLRVKSIEHLFATKIARGGGKDINDALLLSRFSKQAGKPIDHYVVEEVLLCPQKKYNVPSELLKRRYNAFRELEKTLG